VLTTGFNVRDIDFLVLLRATKSPVLYVQILGRALRTADGKTDALIADFTDTIATLGPVDAIKGRVPTGKRKGEAPTKLCGNCGNPNPASAKECVECGHPFPEPELIKHGVTASAAAVLSSQKENLFETVPVTEVRYRLHHKEGKPPSLRVEYYDGMLKKAAEWCCLSHEGFARTKAEKWWQQRSKIDAIPSSTEEAIEWLEYDNSILRAPEAIIVTKAEKYPSIVSYHWERRAS
jgi:DNA repair protein RadD